MIMVGEKYRLRRLDDKNIVIERGGIQEEGKQAGEWVSGSISYYATFALAVNALVTRLTNEAVDEISCVEDLKKLSLRLEEIRVELMQAVAEIKNGKAEEKVEV